MPLTWYFLYENNDLGKFFGELWEKRGFLLGTVDGGI
jgi:hypothetical protein